MTTRRKYSTMRETGAFIADALATGAIWVNPALGRVYSRGSRAPDKSIGAMREFGYVRAGVRVRGVKRNICVHHIVWVAVNGVPDLHWWNVSHINGDPSDNRAANLSLWRGALVEPSGANDVSPPLPSDLPGERWMQVPDLPSGYDASSMGRIRSWRGGGHAGRMLLAPHVKRPLTDKAGYPRVIIYMGGKLVSWPIHQLVMRAFAGPRPDGQVVRHLDGNPGNNTLENLAWGTPADNAADAMRHGRIARGERNGMAKLTQAQADEIRGSSGSCKAVGERYGVSAATVCLIRNRRIYVENRRAS